MGLVTWSGGQSVSMTDAFAKAGLRVPRLEEKTYTRFREFFAMVGASYFNPIDIGGMNKDHNATIVEILARDANVNLVAMQLSIWSFRNRPDQLADLKSTFLNARKKSDKPFILLAASPDPLSDAEALSTLNRELQGVGIPCYFTFERAAGAMRKLVDYHQFHANGRCAP